MTDKASSDKKFFILRLEDGEYLTEIPPRRARRSKEERPKNSDDALIEIKSPIPGIVTTIFKKENEFVKSSETLLRLEAMKMENEITARSDGKVLKINVSPGARVAKNETLAVIKKN